MLGRVPIIFSAQTDEGKRPRWGWRGRSSYWLWLVGIIGHLGEGPSWAHTCKPDCTRITGCMGMECHLGGCPGQHQEVSQGSFFPGILNFLGHMESLSLSSSLSFPLLFFFSLCFHISDSLSLSISLQLIAEITHPGKHSRHPCVSVAIHV